MSDHTRLFAAWVRQGAGAWRMEAQSTDARELRAVMRRRYGRGSHRLQWCILPEGLHPDAPRPTLPALPGPIELWGSN